MIKRKLPIGGVQTFSKLRERYDVYVDKTMRIYDMATRYEAVFLARPRRFGKSLLCSTIKSLFLGEKELFEGLAISATDWEWKAHPVIHLEMGTGNYASDGAELLRADLNSQFRICADICGVDVDFGEQAAINFKQLIYEVYKKSGSVVIIIDEYDNPLLSTIGNPELSEKIRDDLKGFFSVLKHSDQFLRFTFITGVTKFAQISMFSGFNQPMDISMAREYCDICGITQDELETYFAPEIEAYAPKYGGKEEYLAKLKSFYNGYCFTEDRVAVYNTYGILNHFNSSGKFSPFWSMSGAPSFMLKYFEAKDVDIVDIEDAQMRAKDFGDYRDNTITLFPLLYQAGYLTISDYNELEGSYRLKYPNIEVRQSLAEFLSRNYSKADSTIQASASTRLVESLLSGKPEDFMSLLKRYLNKVDYSLSSKITEHYFEFAVSNIINMLGLECRNEAHTANGRMDSVIFAGRYIYILEFKVDKPVETALWQLEEKDYASFYADSNKTITQIGIVFSREQRNIIKWDLL